MKKLPRLPEHPTLDEVAAWLTEASDEVWRPSAVLSRLLEWDRPEILPDGTVRQSRIATSREVWVVVPPGEAMTAQIDGAEVVTRGGLLAYILEPIDLFVSTVWHCGEAVPINGVSTQAGERFHMARSFSVRDIRIPRNDAFQLLSAFDQLVLELNRGEHSDLARLVDDRAHGSKVSPTTSNQFAGQEKTTMRRETQADRVDGWLTECESRAAKKEKTFDRWNMPGKKADFLDLLKRLDADFMGMKSVQSLDRYLNGRCKWSLSANANPDARPLYEQLFPEAFGGQPGAASDIPAHRKKT